jgi:hypothetical protein
MGELRRIRIDRFVTPAAEHRITLVQLAVTLEASPSGGAPFRLAAPAEHIPKLMQALRVALAENWSGIVVFPEICIPVAATRELLEQCRDLVRSRPPAAGGCVVMLPLEHLSLASLDTLIGGLLQPGSVALGDAPSSGCSLLECLFDPVPPAERSDAFVNVALQIVIPTSGADEEALLFVQPKLFPYPGERTPTGAIFVPGRITYLLELGSTRVMGAICFDMIAQPPGMGLFLGGLVEEVQRRFGDLDYLLVPQCNQEPLDHSFQRALADLYHRSQVSGRTLRVVSPNAASVAIGNSRVVAGNSWFVTCPFGSDLPALGVWERTLPSIVKDPSTSEIIRDAPSLGHHAQRLRLSAHGEWIVELTMPPADHLARSGDPNEPLSPHRGRIYHWLGSEWQKKDASMFARDCRRAERLPGLEQLIEVREWIGRHSGGAASYNPTYAEYADGDVGLPRLESDRAARALRRSDDLWVMGARGCGKTVFGIGVALHWAQSEDGVVFFADLGDTDVPPLQLASAVKADIAWALEQVAAPILVVVDNAQTQENTALELVRHIHGLRRSGVRIQALLIGRPTRRRQSVVLDGQPPQSTEILELEANEEAFLCVARRLIRKAGEAEPSASLPVAEWVSGVGGDLAVFAAVFDPRHVATMSRTLVSAELRQRYIAAAESQPGAQERFFELCLLSSLDVPVDDLTLWGQTVETMYPLFCHDGTILRLQPREANPRSYCRLFHSSLGEVLLHVRTGWSDLEFRTFFLDTAIALCSKRPSLLQLIHRRLSSGRYRNLVSFAQWSEAVNRTEGLAERALCASPTWAVTAFQSAELPWTWERLASLPHQDGLGKLLASLEGAHADTGVVVLKYLDRKGLSLQTRGLAEQLAASDEFFANMLRTPSNFAVVFLKYLDDRDLGAGSRALAERLAAHDDFVARMARTPPNFAVVFLRYLDGKGLAPRSRALAERLAADDGFVTRMARTPSNFVVVFLRYLDEKRLTPQSCALAEQLLTSDEFFANMLRTPSNFAVVFFKYLDDRDLGVESRALAERLAVHDEFVARMARTPADSVVVFLRYLDKRGLAPRSRALAKQFVTSDEFFASMLRTPSNFAVVFFKYLDDLNLGTESRALAETLAAHDEFVSRIARAHADSAVVFFRYLGERGLNPQKHALAEKLAADAEFVARMLRESPALHRELLGYSRRAGHIEASPEQTRALGPRVGTTRDHAMPLARSKAVPLDVEYPQERLLHMPIGEIRELLIGLAVGHNRKRLTRIVRTLFSDEEKARGWLCGLSGPDSQLLRQTLGILHVDVPAVFSTILPQAAPR